MTSGHLAIHTTLTNVTHDLPELGQMASKRVDRLSTLPDQQLSHLELCRRPLLLVAFNRREAHVRPLCRRIILLTPHERLT